jgi:hypothetical protein
VQTARDRLPPAGREEYDAVLARLAALAAELPPAAADAGDAMPWGDVPHERRRASLRARDTVRHLLTDARCRELLAKLGALSTAPPPEAADATPPPLPGPPAAVPPPEPPPPPATPVVATSPQDRPRTGALGYGMEGPEFLDGPGFGPVPPPWGRHFEP